MKANRVTMIGSAVAFALIATSLPRQDRVLHAAEDTASLTSDTAFPSRMIPNIPDSAEAYYAPNSKYLIAQARDKDAVKTPFGTDGALTYIYSDDGEEIWRVNDHGQDGCSFFFPDGEHVVWTSTRDNMDLPKGNWSDQDDYPQGAELYKSDLKGGNVQRLTTNKNYEAEVAVSPDGEWIVFGRQIDGNMDLWVMRSDGTDERRITATKDWQEGAPFFMPDSEHIVFRAWRNSEYGKTKPTPMTFFSIKRDGTEWRRHTFDRGMNWHPFPAPDGHHFAIIKATGPTDWEVFLQDIATGESKQLTSRGGFNGMAHISPDGQKLVWSRSTGERFMTGIRTFVMDVSSLGLGPENYVAWDPNWGEAVERDPSDPPVGAQ
ncbi:MAG: PD40 domain-containing protein [Rhodobacteraceae bacterium]|nr:PD40 domain-containing protein [Paracoccaceae bacterium]